MREATHGDGFAGKNLPILLLQFCHGCRSGTAGALIACHPYAPDVTQLFDGLQSHHHHNRRAVGIGYDIARTVQCIGGIDLRHDEGDIIVHTERAGVVDHDCPVLRDGLCILTRDTATCRDECHIHIAEGIIVLQLLHFYLSSAIFIHLPGTSLTAKEFQFVDRERPLCQHPQELLPHGAARTDYRYIHISF